jgi:hypothetical protein
MMQYDHFSMLPERAFQKRPFGGMTLEGGKSAPPPDYGPLASASKESAEIMASLGREQLGFARQQYSDLAPIVRGLADQQAQAQEEQMRQAQDYYDYAQQTFRPVEQGIVRRAQEFNTEAYREQLAQKAAAEAGRAFGITQDASERAMASMGVNPASGRFAGMQSQNQLGLTAQRTGAMTGARQQAEQMGYARLLDAAGLGRGLPGLSTAAYGGATGAGSAAAGTYMAPGNQYMTGMAQGINTIGSGRGMLQSGQSTILNNQANLYGQSMQTRGEVAGSIFGAGGRMLAASPFITSDIRLKTNIKPTGIDSRTNLPTYEFAYKAAPTLRYRGVMAQDVEKLYPQAVSEDASGYKRVRYDMLGMSMERIRS